MCDCLYTMGPPWISAMLCWLWSPLPFFFVRHLEFCSSHLWFILKDDAMPSGFQRIPRCAPAVPKNLTIGLIWLQRRKRWWWWVWFQRSLVAPEVSNWLVWRRGRSLRWSELMLTDQHSEEPYFISGNASKSRLKRVEETAGKISFTLIPSGWLGLYPINLLNFHHDYYTFNTCLIFFIIIRYLVPELISCANYTVFCGGILHFSDIGMKREEDLASTGCRKQHLELSPLSGKCSLTARDISNK